MPRPHNPRRPEPQPWQCDGCHQTYAPKRKPYYVMGWLPDNQANGQRQRAQLCDYCKWNHDTWGPVYAA